MSLLGARCEDIRQRRRRLLIEVWPGEVGRAGVGQPDRIEPFAEDRAVNHLSIASSRWRSVWTKDHSPLTDTCTILVGESFRRRDARSPTRRATRPTRRACFSGSEAPSTVRNGYQRSCSLTNAVTSTP